MSEKMHADELEIDTGLVRRLVEAQQPQWAGLALERVASSGTDNAMYRLGDDLVVRLPRIQRAVHAVEKEHRWLPALAPHLPLAIPVPIAKGEAGEGYPWPWSVYSWLPGEDAFQGGITDLVQAARDIGELIAALQAIDTTGGPYASAGRRGAPLLTVDEQTRRSIATCGGLVDIDAVTAAWESALRLPEWDKAPVWFHADIASGNLLVQDGRITSAIDFSGIGVGDPACDLVVAWELLDVEARAVLGRTLHVDDATWARGRGWALCTALWALPYYLRTNPVMATQARHKIAAVLSDPPDAG